MSDNNPLGSFVQGWSKLNAESMRRYLEIQGEGMRTYADANRVLLEALRDAKSLTDAAAAQRTFFETIQQNGQEALAKQVELARQMGQETQQLFTGLIKRD